MRLIEACAGKRRSPEAFSQIDHWPTALGSGMDGTCRSISSKRLVAGAALTIPVILDRSHITFHASTACRRLRGNRSSTNEKCSPAARRALDRSGQYQLSRPRPFAADRGTDERGSPEKVRIFYRPGIGRSGVADHSNPKIRGPRRSESSPAGTALGKRPRLTGTHLALHLVEHFHSRSSR